MATGTCRTCKFFNQDNGHGRCHLHPPAVFVFIGERMELDSVHAVKLTEQIKADYPIILEPDNVNSWCGDYQ